MTARDAADVAVVGRVGAAAASGDAGSGRASDGGRGSAVQRRAEPPSRGRSIARLAPRSHGSRHALRPCASEGGDVAPIDPRDDVTRGASHVNEA